MEKKSSSQNIFLSIVVPVYNEEKNIKQLHKEILKVCNKIGREFEIIFVNDGSDDNSLVIMKELSPLKIINLRKNFGQTAAFDAGFKQAKGELVASLDADLQNDPAEIPEMIEMLQSKDLDVVSGWRKDRKDTLFKRFISRGANKLRGLLINDGIHDSGCSLKVYRNECFDHLDLYGEKHRFIPALLKIKGFKIGEKVVNHRPRKSGSTKYGWQRIIKGFLDLISVWFWKKFANRPLHLFGTAGLVLGFISIISGLVMAYQKIFLNVSLSDTVLTDLTLFGFFTSIQFFVFGLIAGILSKIYFSSTKDQSYFIQEIITNEQKKDFTS